jgi:SAM-dependent methyltransferase
MSDAVPSPCVLCGATRADLCELITHRPRGEVDYGIPADAYVRRIMRCGECRVFFNDHGLLPETFYVGAYNDAAYGERFRARYDAVMALPSDRSDNKQRAARLDARMRAEGREPSRTRILDIGSGLGVFAAEMGRLGYEAHVIDPDARAVKHALEVVGVRGGSVGSLESVAGPATFDLVTLNKVLEHVPHPLRGLRTAARLVAPGGMIYVELPDGEAASAAGGFVERSEFFVEHFTAFGPESLVWLVGHAGLDLRAMERLHEPSGKCTIYALAERDRNG